MSGDKALSEVWLGLPVQGKVVSVRQQSVGEDRLVMESMVAWG